MGSGGLHGTALCDQQGEKQRELFAPLQEVWQFFLSFVC